MAPSAARVLQDKYDALNRSFSSVMVELTERSAEMFCILSHAAGTITDTDLEASVNPETDCDNRSVDQIFDARLNDDGGFVRGDLVQFCADGPLREVSLCTEACANV